MPASIEDIKGLLGSEEVIEPISPSYAQESRTWAAQKDLKPRLIARPATVKSLARLIACLGDSELDFTVRCGGVGSASAKDVLISLAAFDGFEFQQESETITIGAGQVWGEVDRKMEQFAPGYAAISARCTYVGVGGSIITGGISWLSSEYGLASDPQNMLDAQVVKANGQVLWASAEPDLLWALRGGGGGFGVVTALKLKVYKYTSSIYSGQIIFPKEGLHVVARRLSDWVARSNDPKMALHLYCLDLTHGAFTGQKPTPGIAILIFDANGEEHGRSDAGFKWALDIEGAIDLTKSMTHREVNQLGDSLKVSMGLTNTWMSGATIPMVDEKLIKRAFQWFDDLLKLDPRLSAATFVLIEVMQRPAFQSIQAGSDCGWPHMRNRHILQLGTGAMPGSKSLDDLAFKVLKEAPYEIYPEHDAADYIPNFLQSYNDYSKVYGENFDRLRKLEQKFDPKGVLKGPFKSQVGRVAATRQIEQA